MTNHPKFTASHDSAARRAIEKKIALYLAGDALLTLQAESHDWESLEIRANTTPYPEMAKDLYEIATGVE